MSKSIPGGESAGDEELEGLVEFARLQLEEERRFGAAKQLSDPPDKIARAIGIAKARTEAKPLAAPRQSEIVLPAGTEWVETAKVSGLIARALYPDASGEPLRVSYFTKTARPSVTSDMARPNGWPIDDHDREVLGQIWGDLPPLPADATDKQVAPYVEKANSAGLDWTLDVVWRNPQLEANMGRLLAEDEQKDAIKLAIRDGHLKVVTHARVPTSELHPNSYVSRDELIRYAKGCGIAVRVETPEPQPDGDRITVEHLAWLLSAAQADEQPDDWQHSDRDDGLRRTIAIALRLHGWDADGIAGVIPQIAGMAQAAKIALHRLDGAATTPTAESISANQSGWWMTADDAQRVLAAVRPGVRRYTIAAAAESIAKRVHPKDYIAEHALKTSLVTEMNAAAEREELSVNERRHGEVWVNEYEVDEWLARERKPHRLSVEAQSEKEQADMERAGRLRITQIAETLAKATGIDAARWESTIVDAVKAGPLPLKNPRNLADSLPYSVPKNLRAFYDRVDITDVNRWLDDNSGWGVAYRFTVEAPAAAAPATANEPASDASSTNETGLSKRERQIRAIEATADKLSYERLKIPTGGKTKIRESCRSEYVELFGIGDDPFNGAWKDATKASRVKMANHEEFARR
jgi:hypothetical protein